MRYKHGMWTFWKWDMFYGSRVDIEDCAYTRNSKYKTLKMIMRLKQNYHSERIMCTKKGFRRKAVKILHLK